MSRPCQSDLDAAKTFIRRCFNLPELHLFNYSHIKDIKLDLVAF